MITNDDSNHDDSDIPDDIIREANASEVFKELDVYQLRPTELRWAKKVLKINFENCYLLG